MFKSVRITFALILMALFALSLVGCAGGVGKAEIQDETVLWASAPTEPAWKTRLPTSDAGSMFIVATSGNMASEQRAREDATRTATADAAKQIEVQVNEKYQKILSSQAFDGSTADMVRNELTTMIQKCKATVKGVTPVEWYLQRVAIKGGVAHRALLLAKVSTVGMIESEKASVNDAIKRAEERQKKAETKAAQEQNKNVIEIFTEAKKNGLFED